VPGLTNGTSYTFIVTAKNAQFVSRPSSASPVTPFPIPTPPKITDVIPKTTSAEIDWSYSQTQVAAGTYNTCALLTTGGIKCWGDNGYGQLGNGTTTSSTTPVDVTGLTSGVTAISTGGEHTCALLTTGGIKCWGYNISGQLGNGTSDGSTTPVNVTGLTSGVTAISTGGEHTCALLTTGGIKCWGRNGNGQLGNGTSDGSTTPVDVTGLTSGVTAISAGGGHTCALLTTGGIKCWGRNGNGQLGNGTRIDSTTPVNVSGLTSGVTSIASGDNHSCALLTTGGIKCWGYNGYGKLGNGTGVTTSGNLYSTTPVDVTGLTSGVTAISTGGEHTCALLTTGGIKCWGRNQYQQLGNGVSGFSVSPVDVTVTSGVTAISTGLYHTCAVLTTGGIKCWGWNAYGQLGDGANDSNTPINVTGLTSGVTAISTGGLDTCALLTTGGVKCWGYNDYYGQLGNGTITTPVDVTGLTSGVTAISTGGSHTCALLTTGGIKCWGNNFSGQLGNGTTTASNTPINVTGLTSGVTAISTGWDHTCALLTTGGITCWGNNAYGQLGDGTVASSTTPVDVTGLTSGVTAISTGTSHTCALLTTGGVKCWGANLYRGQLGNGTTTGSTTPVDVTGLTSGVTAISASDRHTCALLTTGAIKCWGDNDYGQLGNGNTGYSTTPVDVTGLTSGVTAISASDRHTCALLTTGGIKCWGGNQYGELGNGTTTNATTPVDVTGLTSGVTAISTGGSHTCALLTTGGIKCWGNNDYGQLGAEPNKAAEAGLSYTAKAIEDPTKSCVVNAPASTCTIVGLNPGQTYRFTVTASNAFLTSIPSAPSDPVTIS